ACASTPPGFLVSAPVGSARAGRRVGCPAPASGVPRADSTGRAKILLAAGRRDAPHSRRAPHPIAGKEAVVLAKLSAEFLGTFWLVLGGCGSAVLAAAFPEVGIGLVGVSLAFGLTVLTGAYALGPISGGHFNPAVSVGLWAGGR